MKAAISRRDIGLFIVDNDPSIATTLRNYLELRFGPLLTISIFSSGAEALAAIDQKTEIIVLENYLLGETGTDIRHSIKKKNRQIQVFASGVDQETADAIEAYSKDDKSRLPFRLDRRKLHAPILKALTYPGRKLAKEFEVNEILGIVVTSIFFIGIVVGLSMAFLS